MNGKINRFADKIAWIACFNSGVRVVDLSDPYHLKELEYTGRKGRHTTN